MKAVTGNSHQKVGWVVIVQRKYGSIPSNPPWQNQFTSAEMTAFTNASTYASFPNDRNITVTVPYGPNAQDQYATYRVMIKMIWHNANGSVQGTALHRVDHYGLYDLDNDGQTPANGKCDAYWYP